MLKVGLLASGDLGYKTAKKIIREYDVQFVLTDRASASIIQLCELSRLACMAGNPRSGRGYEFIKDKEIDVIISINYLFLIDRDIIDHAAILAFNVHGSLLPKYRGRTPHVWAIINSEKKTGITAHVIDEGCDTGDILEQVIVPIDPDMSGNDLLTIFKQSYYPIIRRVLQQIEAGKIVRRPQEGHLATYFGKRTPKDGHIVWSWHRERIHNFIRAQRAPYPGAFALYEGHKIVFHESRFSQLGFHQSDENGRIQKIEHGNLYVKTPNGCLTLVTPEYSKKVNLIVGTILT